MRGRYIRIMRTFGLPEIGCIILSDIRSTYEHILMWHEEASELLMAEEYYFEWMAFTSCVIALQVGFKASPIL